MTPQEIPSDLQRAALLVGADSLAALSAARVAVFGVGGVGSWCAEALLRSGVGHITLVDADCVDITNINRQLPATSLTVGQPKVEVMRRRLLEIRPGADVRAVHSFYSPQNADEFALGQYDAVVDAIDSLDSKADLMLRCSGLPGVALFSSMGAARRLDPGRVAVAEFWRVKGCPLARALRQRFKRSGRRPARPLTCVYSDEQPSGQPKGTSMAVTATFGLRLAALVTDYLTHTNPLKNQKNPHNTQEMKKTALTIAACSALAVGTSMCTGSDKTSDNPFLQAYTTEFEIPPFEQISVDHYIPALEAGIEEQNANIAAIVANPEAPTFDNTILALENSSPILDRVNMVFFALTESDASAELDSVSAVYIPRYTDHSGEMFTNDSLFTRVKAVYEGRDALALDQQRLTEKYYKRFQRAGAELEPAAKDSLKAVNARLADLYLQFNKNLLAATNAFEIVVDDESRLQGLPQSSVAQAAEAAAERGYQGKWVFTLHAPSRLPLLQYAADRDLRRQMYEGYTSLASSGEYNNYPVINEILKARAEKARLLGYPNFGEYMTSNVMSGSVDAARSLLMQIWQPAVKRVAEEVAEMQAVVNEEGGDFAIQPWDYYYYAEKVRQKKYDLDENEVRNYFPLDSVRNGAFTAANRLYGITFTELPDAPKYHPDVKVYEVKDADGNHLAVFMTDYFPRASKRQGAWMSDFKGSWVNADGTPSRPVVYNVGNFTKPTKDTPSLLTIDEVETTFHEFGHALHSMLSKARYPGIAGTNVDRDFVELPSQINEHWAFTPELLSQYAKHYQTGAPIPAELVAKLEAASNHNQGFATAELAGAALLDLAYSEVNPTGDIDIAAFESEVGNKLGMPAQLTYRYRSPYFKHIFGSDEYAAGYYTYLWAEVLDADGFELFKEKGIFDPATAAAFKTLLESGDSEDPMKLFVTFRGHAPEVSALLRNRGLAD